MQLESHHTEPSPTSIASLGNPRVRASRCALDSSINQMKIGSVRKIMAIWTAYEPLPGSEISEAGDCEEESDTISDQGR